MIKTLQLIDPRGTTPNEWCDRMVLELDAFGTIPIIGPETSWKDWAREVNQLTEISIFNPPNPDQYEDGGFEDWAIDFNDSISAGE